MDKVRDGAVLLGVTLVFAAIGIALTVIALLISAAGAWMVS